MLLSPGPAHPAPALPGEPLDSWVAAYAARLQTPISDPQGPAHPAPAPARRAARQLGGRLRRPAPDPHLRPGRGPGARKQVLASADRRHRPRQRCRRGGRSGHRRRAHLHAGQAHVVATGPLLRPGQRSVPGRLAEMDGPADALEPVLPRLPGRHQWQMASNLASPLAARLPHPRRPPLRNVSPLRRTATPTGAAPRDRDGPDPHLRHPQARRHRSRRPPLRD